MLSTAPSPTSFSDFRTASGADQLVVDYFQGNGTVGCIHLVPTAAGIPGVQNGTDLTFQVVFDDGSGGTLYQVIVIVSHELAVHPDGCGRAIVCADYGSISESAWTSRLTISTAFRSTSNVRTLKDNRLLTVLLACRRV